MKDLKLYHLTFLDHVQGHDRPIRCFLVGYLVKENDDSWVVSPWVVDHPEFYEDNLECFCILKSAVQEIYQITV